MPSQTNNPITQASFPQKKLVRAGASLDANAGASKIFGRAIPTNRKLIISGIVRAAAGVIGATIAFTATNANETFTSAAAHGIATGTPVKLGGTLAPTGLTLGTTYFARAASATTITLHATSADAVANASILAFTGDGTDVTLTPTVVSASYQVFGAVVNKNGVCALEGTPVIDSLEDVAGWACTITADNTNKEGLVNVTPDVDQVTRVEALLELYEVDADVIV